MHHFIHPLDRENDTGFFMEVLKEFIDHVDHQIPIIETAVRESDFTTIQKESHAIKGGSANLTAMELSLSGAALEDFARSKEIALCSAQFENLKKAFYRLKTYAGNEMNFS